MTLDERIEYTQECLECAETQEEQEHFQMELDLLYCEKEQEQE